MTFSFWAVYLIIAVYTFLLLISSREIFPENKDGSDLSNFILFAIVSLAFPLLLVAVITAAVVKIYREGKTK